MRSAYIAKEGDAYGEAAWLRQPLEVARERVSNRRTYTTTHLSEAHSRRHRAMAHILSSEQFGSGGKCWSPRQGWIGRHSGAKTFEDAVVHGRAADWMWDMHDNRRWSAKLGRIVWERRQDYVSEVMQVVTDSTGHQTLVPHPPRHPHLSTTA